MHRNLIFVFALFSLPLPHVVHAQFTEAISAPTPSAMDVQLSEKSPYEVVNNSRIFTAEVTLTVAWQAKLTNPKGVETDKEYGGRSTQTTVRVGPGQRTIPAFFPPTPTADYVFVGPVQVGIQSVKWPNQWIEARNEESRLRREADQKKREEDARIARQRIQDAADAGRAPIVPLPDTNTTATTDASGPFATFLARLKRSGRPHGYYPGDPHYGAGYYDVNGSWLGKTEPPAADGTPGRNPGFDQFGTPMSLSQFDQRYPDEPAQIPTYAGLLPSAPTASPDLQPWAFDNKPKTWTDEYGRVFLVEPLPPEYQNLTPEQLYGPRERDPLLYIDTENLPLPRPLTPEERRERDKREALIASFIEPSSIEEVDTSEMSAAEIALLTAYYKKQEENDDGFGKFRRRLEAEKKADAYLESQKYFNDTWLDREIQKKTRELVASGQFKNREEARKHVSELMGVTFVSREEMIRNNESVAKLGLYDARKIQYRIDPEEDEDSPPAPAASDKEQSEPAKTSPAPATPAPAAPAAASSPASP